MAPQHICDTVYADYTPIECHCTDLGKWFGFRHTRIVRQATIEMCAVFLGKRKGTMLLLLPVIIVGVAVCCCSVAKAGHCRLCRVAEPLPPLYFPNMILETVLHF